MSIRREDVLRVAELAHLELSEHEVQLYLQQLDSILRYVEKLNELDTEAVEPMAQVLTASPAEADPLREDLPRPHTAGEHVLRNAPEARPPYFRVPKVIER
ncbi:MAG: Asp-tRNA(Asn)/Glu-tRNA(Gln) amidotransferase subunit GatC [Acidobacteriia bacterium]|jgi:aspartyl-tRNA(Asn)/glutamyl-tRNA(Gln) amidotransferase subunit C|nr:Asp-tRNA(Asn)/Glu-tRNA(Gln) amidotransferase subunit GatC [Terriglobia bacterium]